MRALLIVNPNATSTTPAARDLLAHALESRMQLTVAHTMHRGHAAELAAWAAGNEMDLVVVHGGDGTINEAINGFLPAPGAPVGARSAPRIGVLPGGSANVFARSLGIEGDPVLATNQLIDLLAVDARRRIGLGYAQCTPTPGGDTIDHSRWFAFNAGLGLDAIVCATIDANRGEGRAATPGRYLRTTIREFFRSKGKLPTLTVELPDAEPVEQVSYAFVSNASPWTYLNTRPICTNPSTSYDSGLGVFAMRSTNVLSTLRVAGQLLRTGAQPKSRILFRTDDVPSVRIRSSEPIAFQLDGDYAGEQNEVRFTSMPNVLDVVAPAIQTSR
ncbi:MAG: diacylglycerol kinase family lipid kinase [Aldersonia sp.]|nr:diacylglycerol kinase family lipid kinase [Aldersonia sp.]